MEQIGARQVRRRVGMKQKRFWSRLGVSQSGGSRYESGHGMPPEVTQLLRLVHVEVLAYQKEQQAEFHGPLARGVKHVSKEAGTKQSQERRLTSERRKLLERRSASRRRAA